MYHAFHNRAWDFAEQGEGWEEGARRAWRGTLACVSQVDNVFGMLLKFLDEQGLADNTIVVYGADHGCYHGIHGIEEKAPGICSDAVCRVPMLWRVPGIETRGMVSDVLIENVDISPTLLFLCGVDGMDSADGLDVSGLLSGDVTSVHDVAVTENLWSKSLRWDRWRLVHYPREVMAEDVDEGELYDLASDPNETRNLYHDPGHREIVHEGRRLLLEWLIRTTRMTTSQSAYREMVEVDVPLKYQVRDGDTGLYDYPLAGDGRAPNVIQPRFNASRIDPSYI
jgi:arylsulfatase A-like enzyme